MRKMKCCKMNYLNVRAENQNNCKIRPSLAHDPTAVSGTQ